MYLAIGVLPAEAQQDLDLGILGQLAMCDQENQNVSRIIEQNLAFYDVTLALAIIGSED